MIILDTDCLSLIERKSGAEFLRLSARLTEFPPDEIATSIITFEEQMRGWMAFIAKANSIEKQVSVYGKLARFLESYRYIPIVQFDEKAGKVFQELKSGKIRVGTMDLKIASIVISQKYFIDFEKSFRLSSNSEFPRGRLDEGNLFKLNLLQIIHQVFSRMRFFVRNNFLRRSGRYDFAAADTAFGS
jgi:tRNA(fMet)-specific endonuclease VapC